MPRPTSLETTIKDASPFAYVSDRLSISVQSALSAAPCSSGWGNAGITLLASMVRQSTRMVCAGGSLGWAVGIVAAVSQTVRMQASGENDPEKDNEESDNPRGEEHGQQHVRSSPVAQAT